MELVHPGRVERQVPPKRGLRKVDPIHFKSRLVECDLSRALRKMRPRSAVDMRVPVRRASFVDAGQRSGCHPCQRDAGRYSAVGQQGQANGCCAHPVRSAGPG